MVVVGIVTHSQTADSIHELLNIGSETHGHILRFQTSKCQTTTAGKRHVMRNVSSSATLQLPRVTIVVVGKDFVTKLDPIIQFANKTNVRFVLEELVV